MDFLVEISIRADAPAELASDELARARELHEAGTIRELWRVVGARRNIGMWSAATHEELHDAISSLPLFAWMEATVTPLSQHPVDRDRQRRRHVEPGR